ncbi:PilT/PilU family type 4a pilus ATPase [Candidatus Peregrinibacteria bacterium]|nr:PilT/PilU family type 4a pilus ATPase [Candidatus Peregrinibacteria bacterium]
MTENTQTTPQASVAPANSAPAPVSHKVTLDQLVNLCIEKEASDIHFGEGSMVALRVGGKLVFIENIEPLSKSDADAMINSIVQTDDEKQRLERVREIDLSYTHSSGVNFRVNVFYQRGRLSASMRMISKHLPTMDELGIPEILKKFLSLKEGLIIVAGSAGSGKSTSVQAMLEYVNQNMVEHIVTIENPIEHVFEDEKSFFSQREIGKDTLTMANALNSAMREDPNIIMVSEINDLETLENVLTVVETGHLVIASMSTKDAKQTLERMVSMFPLNQHPQAQDRLAENMICILAQDLVDRIDQVGRIGIYELLMFDSSVKNIVKHGNLSQLKTAIQSGSSEGMISMDSYAYQMAEQGVISKEDVEKFVQRD